MIRRAKKSAMAVLKTGLLLAILAGCVSTTTNTNTRPMEPTGEASSINYQLGIEYYRSGKYNTARDRLDSATQRAVTSRHRTTRHLTRPREIPVFA